MFEPTRQSRSPSPRNRFGLFELNEALGGCCRRRGRREAGPDPPPAPVSSSSDEGPPTAAKRSPRFRHPRTRSAQGIPVDERRAERASILCTVDSKVWLSAAGVQRSERRRAAVPVDVEADRLPSWPSSTARRISGRNSGRRVRLVADIGLLVRCRVRSALSPKGGPAPRACANCFESIAADLLCARLKAPSDHVADHLVDEAVDGPRGIQLKRRSIAGLPTAQGDRRRRAHIRSDPAR